MYKVKIYVTLKESVLDPQGSAVNKSMHMMGYENVTDVRIGKYMELIIEKGSQNIDETVKNLCEKLLVNPVIEDYRYEIEESVVL